MLVKHRTQAVILSALFYTGDGTSRWSKTVPFTVAMVLPPGLKAMARHRRDGSKAARWAFRQRCPRNASKHPHSLSGR